MALVYWYGRGLQKCMNEAIRHYRLAVEEGSDEAQFELAELYENGEELTQQCGEAARLYGLAAEQGNTDALFRLAEMYREGRGVEQDIYEAVRLYLPSGEGNLLNWVILGEMHRDGHHGLATRLQEAVRLFRLAAKDDDL